MKEGSDSSGAAQRLSIQRLLRNHVKQERKKMRPSCHFQSSARALIALSCFALHWHCLLLPCTRQHWLLMTALHWHCLLLPCTRQHWLFLWSLPWHAATCYLEGSIEPLNPEPPCWWLHSSQLQTLLVCVKLQNIHSLSAFSVQHVKLALLVAWSTKILFYQNFPFTVWCHNYTSQPTNSLSFHGNHLEDV